MNYTNHDTVLLFFSLSAQRHSEQQQHRKNTPCKNALFQIAAKKLRYKSDQSRTAGTANITAKRQKRKHRSTTLWKRSRCLAERSRPHDTNRKSAQRTADQA